MSGWIEWQDGECPYNTVVLFAFPAAHAHGKATVEAGWHDPARAPFSWVFIDDTKIAVTGCCDREDDDRVSVNGSRTPPSHWMRLPGGGGSIMTRPPAIPLLFAGLLTGTAIVAVIAAHAGTLGYMVGVR